MVRTSNAKASKYVADRVDFKGSNTFGENEGKFYIVYSYGRHFILYLYDKTTNKWFGSEDKYSVSTSKQQTQLHPNKEVMYLPQKELKNIINFR